MQTITSEEQLDTFLSEPPDSVHECLSRLDGDLVVLGAGGKMGPSLCRMAHKALCDAGSGHRVYAVSRFSSKGLREALEGEGIATVAADLHDPSAWSALPDAAAVQFMVGVKFGTAVDPTQTWRANTWIPGLCAHRYQGVPTVAYSTGNVYPFVPVGSGGATEATPPTPQGEYAWSVLGRERAFEHAARHAGTPVLLYRLNYAVELRYGVLVDLAQRLLAGRPVRRTVGHVNVVWQREAVAASLLALPLATCPARALNFTGRATLRVHELAETLSGHLGVEPRIEGEEAATALLSNATEAWSAFALEETPIDDILRWTAAWLKNERPVWSKPTHYEVDDGRF